jgi:hypothetical protein
VRLAYKIYIFTTALIDGGWIWANFMPRQAITDRFVVIFILVLARMDAALSLIQPTVVMAGRCICLILAQLVAHEGGKSRFNPLYLSLDK